MSRPQLPSIACIRLSILSLSALLNCGCSPSKPQLADVSGIITLDGDPLPYKSVTFVPIDGSKSNGAAGYSDGQGRYTLKAYAAGVVEDHDGCPPGEYRVVVDEPILPITEADFQISQESSLPSYIELPTQPWKTEEFADATTIPPGHPRPVAGAYRQNMPSSIPAIYRSAEQSPLTLTVPAQGGNLDISLLSPPE
ncbi:MAG: carboxypeptidase regulatory-like domain-containing protein [Planctomycetales bacterium]|nr:carboxypeptidase regulatory-like domain-containing protein [Planctomycetales bacterium]